MSPARQLEVLLLAVGLSGMLVGAIAGMNTQQLRDAPALDRVAGMEALPNEQAAIAKMVADANATPPLDVQFDEPMYEGAARVPGNGSRELRYVYFTLNRTAPDGHTTVHEIAYFADGQLASPPIQVGITE